MRTTRPDGQLMRWISIGVFWSSQKEERIPVGITIVAVLSPFLERDDVVMNTSRDQSTSIFERTSSGEMEALFDSDGDQVTVKPQFREGITWHLGNAGDPALVDVLGLQDIVVANRFLCHMHPPEAEACLRKLALLVKPSGYVFVSGVDLSVRTNVARSLRWRPVTELLREIHEGDPSLRRDWPAAYWGLEPFDQRRVDWKMRYASVFQIVDSEHCAPQPTSKSRMKALDDPARLRRAAS